LSSVQPSCSPDTLTLPRSTPTSAAAVFSASGAETVAVALTVVSGLSVDEA
jgi:hypothetical protein